VTPFAEWPPAPDDVLGRPNVAVWGANVRDFETSFDMFHDHLSEVERARAAAFRFERHRSAYVVAHGILRDVLARYVRVDPRAISFETTAADRPYITGGFEGRLDFNLSHAGDAIIVAVGGEQRVGVDVEEVRGDMAHEDLAARFFAPSEIDELRAGDPHSLSEAFFACWTKKEAIVKAVGRGLQIPLDSFSVSVHASRQRVVTGREAWTIVDLGLSSGYSGAVAIETDGGVDRWSWRPSASRDHL
jgi:4'-phosphopantetheinyl transferase